MKASRLSAGLLLVLGASLLGCGAIEDDGTGSKSGEATPPPVNTRFALRVDGKPIDLEDPGALRFIHEDGKVPTYISIGAQEDPGSGDYIRGASVLLTEPFATGTFDCTPNERGEWVNKQASVSPGDFFGFKATLTDCVVEVQYIANDRVVGKFSVLAHAPGESSLSGTVAKAEGEFDVPVKDHKL